MSEFVLDHLWQSTLFAGAAGLLTLALRRDSARIRYGLWFAASAKFLIPFAAFAAFGTWLSGLSEKHIAVVPVLSGLQPLADPFSNSALIAAPAPDRLPIATMLVLALCLIGFLVLAVRWLIRWRRLQRILRDATLCAIAAPVPVKMAASLLEPGLVGIWRPVILLPQGIAERLSPTELDAVLAHEICHLRRRDNLLAAIHMLVEALFWFHPLVWWLGARLNEERERACDEHVLASGQSPDIYAESILKVCHFYLQSPLDCAAGISGADLKTRMETIMENKLSLRLNAAKKTMLAGAATIAIAGPVVAGLVVSPAVLAQPTNASSATSPDSAEQATLRRILESIASGNPPYTMLTPDSASILREQWGGASRIAKDLGSMTSLTFKETQGEFHVYTAVYQHGQTNWIVGPHENGTLDKVIIDSIRIAGTPHPGAQEAARRYIAAMQIGQPNYGEMTPEMAADERKSAERVTQLLKSWGALNSIRYESTTFMGPAGGRKTSRFAPPESLDMFKVDFESHSTELVIELTSDGKIARCLIKTV